MGPGPGRRNDRDVTHDPGPFGSAPGRVLLRHRDGHRPGVALAAPPPARAPPGTGLRPASGPGAEAAAWARAEPDGSRFDSWPELSSWIWLEARRIGDHDIM
jgi:hypothetical protein